jgi:hypothetical protein
VCVCVPPLQLEKSMCHAGSHANIFLSP